METEDLVKKSYLYGALLIRGRCMSGWQDRRPNPDTDDMRTGTSTRCTITKDKNTIRTIL
jgi:hypothetical protein